MCNKSNLDIHEQIITLLFISQWLPYGTNVTIFGETIFLYVPSGLVDKVANSLSLTPSNVNAIPGAMTNLWSGRCRPFNVRIEMYSYNADEYPYTLLGVQK